MESKNRTDRLLHANIEAFEAALQAGQEKVLTPEWPKSYLGVLDGSDQDATTLALLTGLVERHAGEVLLTTGVFDPDASPNEEDALEDALARLAGMGVTAEGVLSTREESHERVLTVLEKRAIGMCVLPCPFSHDLGELGGTTLGTVVEVALAKGPAPVLIVRGPVEISHAFSHPHLLMAEVGPAAAHATRIGLGILAAGGSPQGTLPMTFVYTGTPDPDVDEAIAKGYAIEPADLVPLLSGGLSSFLHRLLLLVEATPGFQVEARLMHPGAPWLDAATEAGRLHILPMGRDIHGVSELVHEFVLSTLDPVLVVPGTG